MAALVLKNQRGKGFKGVELDDYHHNDTKVPAALMLIVSECTEALECFREGGEQIDFAEELADIVIRTVGLSAGLGLDLGWVINRKMTINQARPYRHGVSKI